MKAPATAIFTAILAVAVGTLLGPTAANGQELSGHPARSRVLLGVLLGGGAGDTSWAGFKAGYERRLTDRLSLQLPMSVSWGIGGAAVEAAYSLRRFEVGLAPRVLLGRLSMPARPPGEIQLHLSGQGGFSFDRRSPPARRAITENIDSDVGWYAGAGASVTWLEKWLGATLEFAYRQTRTPEHSTITPIDPAVPKVSEDRRYVEHQIVFTFAGVLAF